MTASTATETLLDLKPLFKRVLFGTVEGAIKVGGSALLPRAWPIVERALKPVLERLEERFTGDIKVSKELAEKAVEEFENDARLQELWRGALVEELQPFLAANAPLNDDLYRALYDAERLRAPPGRPFWISNHFLSAYCSAS